MESMIPLGEELCYQGPLQCRKGFIKSLSGFRMCRRHVVPRLVQGKTHSRPGRRDFGRTQQSPRLAASRLRVFQPEWGFPGLLPGRGGLPGVRQPFKGS